MPNVPKNSKKPNHLEESDSPLLYIHIPFCDSKCNYCAFNSYTNLNHLKKHYLQALKTQFQNLQPKNFTTMFIGGGTPSTMNIEFYEHLFTFLSPYLKNTKEITIECNPNVTYEWLKELKNMGVNRISFGVQSFNEEKLKFLNRNHSPSQAVKSVINANKAGFENINIDLIYSTALDSQKLLKKDLKTAFSLPINHISAYSLTIEENSKWEGEYSKRKDDEELELWFINAIKEKFFQYEISNFGKICEHNLGYWMGKEYMGLGAGAVGFSLTPTPHRYYPHTDVKKYIDSPDFYKKEDLTKQDLKKEKIFLGLRSVLGFEKSLLNENELKKVNSLIEENKIYEKEGKIHSYDFLLADAISAYILE